MKPVTTAAAALSGMLLMVSTHREVVGATVFCIRAATASKWTRVRGLEIDAWRQAGISTGRRRRVIK